jgi:glycosyltransferase involved in cell wall biosynthesis
VRLLGETTCPQALLSACDLFCLPSAWGEGFPNAVGEAMACELPCVVTRVGDGPDLVGATGLVVDPGDREGLAQALLQLVRLGHSGRARLGARARNRIVENFSLSDVAARYAEVFDEAVSAVESITA